MMNLRKIIVMFLIIASILIYGCSNESQLPETTSASPAATSTSPVPTKDSQQTFGQNHNSWENEVNLGEIPELGYRNISTLDSDNYICYEDILVLDRDFYKKIDGKYEYQKKTVNSLFGIDKDLMVDCRQYENKIVAVSEDKKAFRVYDMDNDSFHEFQCIDEDSFIGPFWSVYDGNILYSEWDSQYIKERTLRRIDLISGDNREIYRPESGKGEKSAFGSFRIRDDGRIMYGIYNREEYCWEFWQLRLDENGEWQEKKIWETREWEFAYMLDFNQYGLVILGEFYNPINLSFYEKVVIKDNGEVEKLSENIQGEYLFLDNGYLLGNRAELEKMPWKEDDPRSLYLCDSVSFYDYEGNEKATYQLISKEKLENRYCLKKLIYSEGIITGLYVQEGIGTLYVSQVRMDEIRRKLSGRIQIKIIADIASLYEKAAKEDRYSFGSTYMEDLYLRGEITQRDVEKIGDMNSLKELDFYIDDSSIDLSPLADLNSLEKLTISSTNGCTDLDTHSLGEIEQLREITLYACEFDISFLAELPNIETITLLKCDVDDISVFKDIDTLKVLNVGYINDVDLNYLSNLINLEEIVIMGHNIRNFEGLKNLINTRRLALCDYDDSRTGDMNMLVEMDRLENIFIAHIKIEDISPLAGLANLSMITLIDTDISDIEPLTELKNLSSLTIMGNKNMQIKEQAEKSFNGVETLVSEDIPYPY